MNAQPDPKMQSGRTTRMLQEAIRLAREGSAVYLVFGSPEFAEQVKRVRMPQLVSEDSPLGIKFESLGSLSNLDWGSMTLRGAHPNCVVLVDHSVIEWRFAKMLEMLVRFDSPEPANPREGKKPEVHFRTPCHPEANGRQPQPGDVSYTFRIPTDDGRELVIEIGEAGFQKHSDLLVDMHAGMPSYGDGSTNVG